jgi:hypothetical protein
MRICPRLLAVLSGVAANRRKPWIIPACALALSSLGLSAPARAQVCTPLDAAGNVTCSAGTYNSNINVNTDNGLGGSPINLTLQPGVIVLSPGGNAVNIANTGGVTTGAADLTINADGVTIKNTANPTTDNNTGLRIQSSGAAIIDATNTTIDVSGTSSTWAILDFAQPNGTGQPLDASVTWNGPHLITLGGVESGAIQADNRGIGDATIVASGDVTVSPNAGVGTTQYGLLAHAGDPSFGPSGAGNASVTYNSGTLNVSAVRPRGILAWVDGNGSATVNTAAGTVINVSGSQFGGPGVYVFSSTATAAQGNALTANVASKITSSGPASTDASNLPVGIRANNSGTDAPISVNYTGPGITTMGGNGVGILAQSGSGTINIDSSGPITTNGSGADGIFAQSGSTTSVAVGPGGDIGVTTSGAGAISTLGDGSSGIRANSTTGTVQVNASGAISTQGAESQGIWANSATGTVQVDATNVSTHGEFSAAINATGGGDVTVNIPSGGSIMGGWQADLTSVGPTDGLPAAGIILNSTGGTATLTNDGSIGALSDLAVATGPQINPLINPPISSSPTSIINNGTITGFVQLGSGDNSILNNRTFDLRDFADTNGDGTRDTVRVVTADFGSGPSNIFNNIGTLALPAVTGATKLDNSGQYLPLDNPNNTMTLNGPLQGQLLGVATFTNSGTINLQSNPVPGDVLMITGGQKAGAAGPGTYVSNGGTLMLDTVLNEGGAATLSDTLVVDGTSVGPKGATKTDIVNARPGEGALTEGDGILVVEVLDPNRSAPNAFTLANPVEDGPFDYMLFHGGVGGDNPGGGLSGAVAARTELHTGASGADHLAAYRVQRGQ